nr:hypothetical protein [Micromonospora sp. DSM 115978]
MADPTISARVKAGAAWLDQHRPGWLDRIDLITLDIGDPECCVIGQLDDDWTGLSDPEFAAACGLLVPGSWSWPDIKARAEYERLTEGWKAYVLDEGRRRAAACCPCRGAVCDPGCTCPSPECPKNLAEVVDV